MFIQSESYTAETYSGWLIITDTATKKPELVQLTDTSTGRNITRQQFNKAVKIAGFDKACRVLLKLAAK